MRKKYLDGIVNWVLHLTSYPGECCKGYKHKYDIAIRDVFTGNKMAVSLHVDNGDLNVEVREWGEGADGKQYWNTVFVPEAELSTDQLRTIYKCLKSINLFKP